MSLNRLHRKRLEDDFLSDKPVEMPDETKGRCNRCAKIAELGDGFCLKCWDKGSNKNKSYPDIRYPPKRRRGKSSC